MKKGEAFQKKQSQSSSHKEGICMKTSLRMRYEAESIVIQKELGSLEKIRESLGMSRRKMSQLLLIDPSTWTRWTQDEKKVPPLVFRSLQWYLALIEKKPIWSPHNTFSDLSSSALISERIKKLETKLEKTLQELNQWKKQKTKRKSWLFSFIFRNFYKIFFVKFFRH